MSWPNHVRTSGEPLRNRVRHDSLAFAQMSRAYVVSACGTVDERMIELLELSPADAELIRNPDICGGSTIVGPDGTVLAGPLGPEEGILYAELDVEAAESLRHDLAGHRPDVFEVRVNTRRPQLYGRVAGSTHELERPRRPRELGEAEPASPEIR